MEEYPLPEHPAASPASVAIVLSARTAEQLHQKVRDLLDFVRARPEDVDLNAMSYTLQTGREAMDERLGFLVSSVADLVKVLDAYLAGDQEIEEAFQGQAKRDKEAVSMFSSDADLLTGENHVTGPEPTGDKDSFARAISCAGCIAIAQCSRNCPSAGRRAAVEFDRGLI